MNLSKISSNFSSLFSCVYITIALLAVCLASCSDGSLPRPSTNVAVDKNLDSTMAEDVGLYIESTFTTDNESQELLWGVMAR